MPINKYIFIVINIYINKYRGYIKDINKSESL